MEDIFKKHANSEFQMFFLTLCKNIKTIHSEIIVPDTQEVCAETWVKHMSQPLDTKNTKYAKSLERILGEKGTCFHACQYKDSDGLPSNFIGVDLKAVINGKLLTDKEKELFWTYIENINRAAFTSQCHVLPRVPTKAEIREEIRNRKLTEDVTRENSVLQAFHGSLKSLADDCNCKQYYDEMTDEEIKTSQTRWHEVCCKDGFIERCKRKDEAVLSLITETFTNMQFTSIVPDSTWKCIQQLNGFTTVNQNIPTNMMGRIENMANVLASSIASGNMDMSSLNLNDIGKEVLAGCTENEMQDFAQNIDKILPALNNFKIA